MRSIMRSVSIIIPVIREDKVETCISAIVKNSGMRMDQYEIIHEFDSDGIGCPKMVAKLRKKCKNTLIMFLGDDTEPEENFLFEAVKAMSDLPDGWGVVGLNTQPGNPLAHWLADERILDLIPGGEFFSLEYAHCYGDNELAEIAIEHGRWVYADKSKVKHNHPVNNTAEDDDGYKKAYSEANRIHDRKTFITRKIDRMRKQGGKLGIGLPLTYDYVHKAFFETYTALVKPPHVQLMPKLPGQIDAVRNDIVEQALLLGCTHLLFIDTDQIYRSLDMIPMMYERMKDEDLKFLSAKVHRRYPPFDPILLKGKIGEFELISEELTDSGDVIELDATGAGCVMIDTRVFLEIESPYFELRKSDTGKAVGEDISFCAKLKEKGHSLFCDTSFVVGHLSMMEVDGSLNKLFRKINKMEAPK